MFLDDRSFSDAPPPIPNRDILIVDDDPDLVRGLARILKLRGHNVRTATDGQHALEMAKEQTPRVVLTDLKMPGMNGIEVIRQLKLGTPDVVAILMTGFAEFDQEAIEAAATTVLTKPLDCERLFEMLAEFAA